MRNSIIVFSFIAVFSPFNLLAQGAPVPHIFGSGNPIISSEFNANFQELSDRNDSTQTLVTQNSSDISSLQTDVTTLQANPGHSLLQFVGNSTGTVDGRQGIRTMTELCQVDFPGSRVCTTEEYAKTISFPAPIPSTTFAWIMPSKITGSGNATNTSFPISELYSGFSSNNGAGVLNCIGWVAGSTGLVVNGVGEMIVSACVTVRAVSCCK